MAKLHVGMLIYNNYNRYKTVYVTLQAKANLVHTWCHFEKYCFEIFSLTSLWYWALLSITSYIANLLNHRLTKFHGIFLDLF